MFIRVSQKFFILTSLLTLAVLCLSAPLAAQEEINKSEEKEVLEQELKELEKEISQYQDDITKTQAEKKNLENKIYVLRKKISKTGLQIDQSNLLIKDLNLQVEDTESSIEQTCLNIEDSQKKLTEILRLLYEEDQKSMVEILLNGDKLSDFFDNLAGLEAINLKNQELLKNIKSLKFQLEDQMAAIGEEKQGLENLVKIKTLQQQDQEETKQEQSWILTKTKGQETLYQQHLKEAEKKAAEIRARIFSLVGVSKAPTFGEAYEIAKYVESMVGIRPAFLLAVLAQESNIGKNVGQCYLTNPKTGAGVVVKTGRTLNKVMAPGPPYSKRNDVAVFIKVTEELGRDPYKTLVSCPMSFGWGGAMGPAQFIPSTWSSYRGELSKMLGRPADPWSIQDAFLASGLYLTDYGAASQDYNKEWRSSLIYFSGGVNLKFRFYADSVMKKATAFQKDIDQLELNN